MDLPRDERSIAWIASNDRADGAGRREHRMASKSWKDQLATQTAPNLIEEIDAFEAQIHLRKAGKLEEKVFAETRLRRGVYGQRYDNGPREGGIQEPGLRYSHNPPTP